jgi:histidinol phosphatase-like enzyme (inositol monophosphatase family)
MNVSYLEVLNDRYGAVEAEAFFSCVHSLADTASKSCMKYFRQNPVTHFKDDSSPVTNADREAEQRMRSLLQASFPHHGVIGEEFEDVRSEARFTWVLDPIDGTKSFISGVPLFGTLIALCDQGRPILGCIDFPALGQRCIGDGGSAWLNGKRITMQPVRSLAESTLLVTDVRDIQRYKHAGNFQTLTERVRLYRSWGDCYGYSLLASGYAHIMIDAVLHPWDVMALLPILYGSGAAVSSYEGNDVFSSNSLVAAHPEIHPQVIDLLNA